MDRFVELVQLRDEFPTLAKDIILVNADANTYLQEELCAPSKNWKNHRAVLFLDPYGMQVEWKTLEAVAATKAIDLWLLFPIGAVNRLLRRDGEIDPAIQARLNRVFGAEDWYEAFYTEQVEPTLFGDETRIVKLADFEGIKAYFVRRLEDIFAAVAPNPLVLRNSKNVPLFLLCFAVGNPYAVPAAMNIAQDILSG